MDTVKTCSDGTQGIQKSAHLLNAEGLPSLGVAGVDGEEEQLVVPEAGS